MAGQQMDGRAGEGTAWSAGRAEGLVWPHLQPSTCTAQSAICNRGIWRLQLQLRMMT